MQTLSTNGVANDILRKGKVEEAKNKINIARIVFFTIAALNFITAVGLFIYAYLYPYYNPFGLDRMTSLITGSIMTVIGIVYIVLGILLPSLPKMTIGIGLGLAILKIVFQLFQNSSHSGTDVTFFLDVVFVAGLVLSFYYYLQYKKLSYDLESYSRTN